MCIRFFITQSIFPLLRLRLRLQLQLRLQLRLLLRMSMILWSKSIEMVSNIVMCWTKCLDRHPNNKTSHNSHNLNNNLNNNLNSSHNKQRTPVIEIALLPIL